MTLPTPEAPKPDSHSRDAPNAEAANSNAAKQTILLVDHDANIRPVLETRLTMFAYDVATASDGEEALALFQTVQPDAVVLDVMMPKMDGYGVIQALRQQSEVPIVMLSACSEVKDRILGLELGADDYITKPFSVAELLARVRAALRRRKDADMAREHTWSMGDVEVDPARHKVWRRDEDVELTATEFEILQLLKDTKGRVLSRQAIFDHIWGNSHHGSLRTIDNFISQLRSKLEADPTLPRYLVTIRGVGYRLDTTGEGK